MDKTQILKLIDERKEELFELLSSLIKINSENFRTCGNEGKIAKYIFELCEELNLETDIYSPLEIENFEKHPDYMPGRNLKKRYNVTARWRGEEDVDGLMLMAHSDTVEIGNVESWNKDPLSGEISDGKIWGRGACDDKYALATTLFIIKLLKEQGFKPKQNILFTAYVDEERGGSHGALASVLKYPCERIINLDCHEGQICNASAGGQGVYYNYHTKNTVDSAKTATSVLPIIMEELEKFGDRRRKELSENRFYKGTIVPETALRYMDIHVGNDGKDLGRGALSFTFYTDKTKEEIQAELNEIENILEQRLEPFNIISDGFSPRTRFFHYVYCEPDSADIKAMLDAVKESGGREYSICGMCLSDMSVISKYGNSNAFAIGAGRDFSVAGGAHQPDEFIECEKFLEFTKAIAVYIMNTI